MLSHRTALHFGAHCIAIESLRVNQWFETETSGEVKVENPTMPSVPALRPRMDSGKWNACPSAFRISFEEGELVDHGSDGQGRRNVFNAGVKKQDKVYQHAQQTFC
ncbi:uncharacterized protein PAC_12728 [Phialocephala subalpina]|uniref:Uncharacterized protein n=1 Tax=Phialocephala subalpina TaxID=576137 RepID=A0A1L7XCS2_9HELO|nr:uncharacterized protein PAC_12728 [Phialocephala subalpina]